MMAPRPKKSKSVYAARKESAERPYTLSIKAENQPGVMARIVGTLSGRGYNIESMTAAEIDHDVHLSRLTIVTSGTPEAMEQIKTQLENIIAVRHVRNLTTHGQFIQRELALLKIAGDEDVLNDALQVANGYNARVVDATNESYVFEISATPETIDECVAKMKPIGLKDVSRTGIAGISKGPRSIGDDE